MVRNAFGRIDLHYEYAFDLRDGAVKAVQQLWQLKSLLHIALALAYAMALDPYLVVSLAVHCLNCLWMRA